MSDTPKTVAELFISHFGDSVTVGATQSGIMSLDIGVEHWLEVCRVLRDDEDFSYEQLTDLCGVDYLGYGQSEWETEHASSEGYSRGVVGSPGSGRFDWANRPEADQVEQRFGIVAHLLSFRHNKRLRIRCFAPDEGMPIVPSLVEIWNSVNWYEREAFDLFGIVFEGHPDLRRILTDYGFTGPLGIDDGNWLDYRGFQRRAAPADWSAASWGHDGAQRRRHHRGHPRVRARFRALRESFGAPEELVWRS